MSLQTATVAKCDLCGLTHTATLVDIQKEGFKRLEWRALGSSLDSNTLNGHDLCFTCWSGVVGRIEELKR